MKTGKGKNYILQYIIYTYVLFLLLLLTLGGIATLVLHGNPLVMRWLIAITAWTSTYVFLIMFKKLYPNSTIKEFYKNAFSARLNIRLLVVITLIQIFIFISCTFMVSLQRGIAEINLLDLSLSIIFPALFFTLIQGATGEETGWRGYLLPAFEKKFGIVKGSFIVSLLWSFWHAPIWFLSSGYSGMDLLKYIMVFVICITSLGFVIGICYYWCRNLLIPIFIHFTFNFLGETFTGSKLDLVSWYAVFYFILAMVFFILIKTESHFMNMKKST